MIALLRLSPLFLFFSLTYIVWFPIFLQLVSEYTRLLSKPDNTFLKKVWISYFFWFFLSPCALLIDDRFYPFFWLLSFMFFKSAVYHSESVAVCIFFIFYVSLLFEHLILALVWYSSKFVRDFLINVFGLDLILYCLGNPWEAPAKKVTIAVATLSSHDSKNEFPNQTLQEYIHTWNQASDKFYNKWFINSTLGSVMSKIFSK